MQIPETLPQKWERLKEQRKPLFDSPTAYYDREINQQIVNEIKECATPPDPRWQQQQKTKWCWTYYMDYNRCKTLKGEDYAPCEYFKNTYLSVCPRPWTRHWDELVEEGRFPGRFDR